MKRALYYAGLVLCVLLTVAPVLAAGQPQTEGALVWLQSALEEDGGFSNGYSPGSDYGTTVEVILAVTAAGQDVSQWQSSAGLSPLDYVATQVAGGELTSAGSLAKALLVAVATGQNPRDFGGKDLVTELTALQDTGTGLYGDTLFAHAYAVLALRNAGQPISQSAVNALTSQFTDDGAWALFGGKTPGTADTNTTALVMQALAAAGERDAAAGALPYLHRMQNEDGGFPYQKPSNWGTDTDANSTAVVLQALYALDETMGDWAGSGTDPLGALTALWDMNSGAFYWQAAVPYANMLATAQAVQAVQGMSLVNLATVGAAKAPTIQFEAPLTLLPESGGALYGIAYGVAGVVLVLVGSALRRK
ncbi:MAG: terpene cyclase/mutase family protein [Anaerolineae bacterium]|nr:terpene cyclase/mutase family protein [Anaerolineae bacterium]